MIDTATLETAEYLYDDDSGKLLAWKGDGGENYTDIRNDYQMGIAGNPSLSNTLHQWQSAQQRVLQTEPNTLTYYFQTPNMGLYHLCAAIVLHNGQLKTTCDAPTKHNPVSINAIHPITYADSDASLKKLDISNLPSDIRVYQATLHSNSLKIYNFNWVPKIYFPYYIPNPNEWNPSALDYYLGAVDLRVAPARTGQTKLTFNYENFCGRPKNLKKISFSVINGSGYVVITEDDFKIGGNYLPECSSDKTPLVNMMYDGVTYAFLFKFTDQYGNVGYISRNAS